jgi:hypothetical protein
LTVNFPTVERALRSNKKRVPQLQQRTGYNVQNVDKIPHPSKQWTLNPNLEYVRWFFPSSGISNLKPEKEKPAANNSCGVAWIKFEWMRKNVNLEWREKKRKILYNNKTFLSSRKLNFQLHGYLSNWFISHNKIRKKNKIKMKLN